MTLYVAVKTLLLQRDRHLATELTLRQAQINVLRSQTNPHFLFNTLNLLASEIGHNPDNARDIVYDLADLLRDSMRAAEREFTTLDEELRLVRLYLSLQQKRFPERLSYQVDVDDFCLSIPVPSLLLQPIIENVIKHVVARSSENTVITIRTSVHNENLEIVVSDTGPQTESRHWHPGGGLRIVDETLRLHYREQAALRLASSDKGGQVTVSLPLVRP